MQWIDCPADGPGVDRGRIAALGPKVHSTMAEIIAGSGSVLNPRGTVVSPRNWQPSHLISFPPAGTAVPRITPAGGREDAVKSIGPGKRLASRRFGLADNRRLRTRIIGAFRLFGAAKAVASHRTPKAPFVTSRRLAVRVPYREIGHGNVTVLRTMSAIRFRPPHAAVPRSP